MKALALQGAIRTRLAAFGALVALVATRIYDAVPHQVDADTFPFVVIGDDTAIPFDTHSTVGAEHTVTIHSWSRYDGRKEIKEIQDALYGALHRHALAVAGVTTVDCQWEFSQSFLEPDGKTRHGVDRFRILLDGV